MSMSVDDGPDFEAFEDVAAQLHSLGEIKIDPDTLNDTVGNVRDLLQSALDSLNTLEYSTHPIETSFKPSKRVWLKPAITKRLLLITVCWQVLTMIIVFLVDKSTHKVATGAGDESSEYVLLAFQLLNLLFTIVVSVKLAKQVKHKSFTASFLVQSYLSSILTFAGIYVLLFRLQESSFKGVPGVAFNPDGTATTSGSITNVFEQFLIFIYFSTTTMSTVGYGDIHPAQDAAYAVVIFQELMSVLYSVLIFGVGVGHITSSTEGSVPSSRKSSISRASPRQALPI